MDRLRSLVPLRHDDMVLVSIDMIISRPCSQLMLHPAFVPSTSRYSYLTNTGLHRILKILVVGSFVAMWKKDADPNDFGCKMFGLDNVRFLEYIETVFDNAAGL